MTTLAAPPRALLRVLVAGVLCTLVASGQAEASNPVTAVLDRTNAEPVEVPPQTERAQDRLRRELGARALLQPDPATGTPRMVARLDGFLTSPSKRDPQEVALDYVREHADAFGLDAGDIASLRLGGRERGTDGTVHLRWEQRSGGLPNVDGGLQAAVTDEGRLLNVRGGTVPDPGSSTPDPRVSPAAAYATALPGTASPPAATSAGDAARTASFAGGGQASLVRYLDDGANRVGWRVLAPAGSSAFYDAIVDARTGRLQRRINRVRFASIRHFDVNPRAPGDSATTNVVDPDWLDSDTRLIGPYVHAISDLNDEISLAEGTPPFGLTREPVPADEVAPLSYAPVFGPNMGFCTPLCSWSGSNREENREFSTAQLFWYLNTFREHLAADPIGFTAARGAFEGNDPVLAQALDGATRDPGASLPPDEYLNNASMLTLPDDYRPLLQVNLFAPGSRRYDGAHDASLVYHEYTHGLTDRTVTDAQGFGAMNGPQPGALGEGTSDFYAMDFLVATQPDQVPNTSNPGEVRLGNYLQQNPASKGLNDTLRTEGLDCDIDDSAPACPGTPLAGPGGYDYADFGRVAGAPEVHNDGEIWAQTLWSLRSKLIQLHPADGLSRARAYVTGGLRLVPENPTFLDMRNAIVQAAVDLNGNDDWVAIWEVFAERGMGWLASTDGPTDVTPFTSDDVPPSPTEPSGRGGANGTVTDEAGAAVAGAAVAIAGHDSGAGLGATGLQATTGANGVYVIPSMPARSYTDLYVRKPGFQEMTTGLVVQAGLTSTTNFAPLRRDYASTSSASSASTSGPDFGGDGCGPTQAIDDDKSTVWSTLANAGSRNLFVDLGRNLDVREVRIDPRAGCGDGPEASLASYELAASDGPGQPFERIAGGTIGALDERGYVSVPLTGDLVNRRQLRLTAIASQGVSPFIDVSELEVTGTPVTVAPPPKPSPTPTPTPPPGPVAKVTSLSSAKLTADRKGFFKVKVRFGDAVPAGKARLTVSRKGKRLARAKTPVRLGKTVTKTLRLTNTGRNVIRRGRSKKVTVELRLPDGKKMKKTVKLERKKR